MAFTCIRCRDGESIGESGAESKATHASRREGMPALKLVGAGPRRSKLSVGKIVKLYAGVLLFDGQTSPQGGRKYKWRKREEEKRA